MFSSICAYGYLDTEDELTCDLHGARTCLQQYYTVLVYNSLYTLCR